MNETDTLLSIDVRSEAARGRKGNWAIWKYRAIIVLISENGEIKSVRGKEMNGEEGIVIWSPCDCPYYNKDVQ